MRERSKFTHSKLQWKFCFILFKVETASSFSSLYITIFCAYSENSKESRKKKGGNCSLGSHTTTLLHTVLQFLLCIQIDRELFNKIHLKIMGKYFCKKHIKFTILSVQFSSVQFIHTVSNQSLALFHLLELKH